MLILETFFDASEKDGPRPSITKTLLTSHYKHAAIDHLNHPHTDPGGRHHPTLTSLTAFCIRFVQLGPLKVFTTSFDILNWLAARSDSSGA